MINSVSYTLTPTPTATPPMTNSDSAHCALTHQAATIHLADYNFHAYIAVTGEPLVSVNWWTCPSLLLNPWLTWHLRP
jgi:hypothetical protein